MLNATTLENYKELLDSLILVIEVENSDVLHKYRSYLLRKLAAL